MAKNVIAYIKQKLKDYDPMIDTRNTAALVDLMVNPLSTILEPYDTEHTALQNQLSISDPTSLSEAEMDQIVANFLIQRDQGDKSRGYIKIYFYRAQDFTLSAGSQVETSAGLKFYTLSNYTISNTQMLANNQRYPLYSTDNILIEAESAGLQYDISPGAISKIYGVTAEFAYVTNNTGFSGGATKENNTAVYTRLLSSVTNETIASPDGITKLIKRNFPSVNTVVVKGMIDDEMARDLSFNATVSGLLNWNSSQYYESDLDGCVSGYHEYPYNQSQAYFGLFQDDAATSGYAPTDLPLATEFTTEFLQNMYANNYRKYDVLYSEVKADIILNQTFNAAPAKSVFPADWSRSDAALGLNNMISNNEIAIDLSVGAVRLGYRYTEDDAIAQPIILPSIKSIEKIIDLLRQAKLSGRSAT